MAEWLPRFTPYHIDLVDELSLQEGQRVLVACCGSGSEVVAVARELGASGYVRATDANQQMVALAAQRAFSAGFPNVSVECAAAEDARGGPWDSIVCAFGLWQLENRVDVLHSWKGALGKSGKVGVMTWGPPEENDPFELITQCLRQHEPGVKIVAPRILSERDSIRHMFEDAGLALVRHTVVRHTLSFPTAEQFVTSLREARFWHDIWAEIGEERMGFVVARFYDRVGGPTAPLPWDAPATLAVAGIPGSEIALRERKSVRVPIPT